jgi:aminoglycoside 6'-N-acetyltransferase
MIKAQSAPAVVPISYGLRAMGPADLAVVRGWLTEPRVTRWWPNPEVALRSTTQHLSEPAIECFVLTMGGQDAGYLQVYDPHQLQPPAADEHASGHPYRDQPRGTRGIDVFIGRGGSSDEATDLASSDVSSGTSSRREYPAW